jgi:hypothetical protein
MSSPPPGLTVTAVASGISRQTPGRSQNGSDTMARFSSLSDATALPRATRPRPGPS